MTTVGLSVTRWLDHLLEIWLFYLQQRKMAQWQICNSKLSSKFCQIQIKHFEFCQRLLKSYLRNFAKSGHTDGGLGFGQFALFQFRADIPIKFISVN